MKIKIEGESKTEDIILKNFLMDELELAHEDYINRKQDSINKLYTIWRNNEIPALYRKWIREAARLLNEKEI